MRPWDRCPRCGVLLGRHHVPEACARRRFPRENTLHAERKRFVKTTVDGLRRLAEEDRL